MGVLDAFNDGPADEAPVGQKRSMESTEADGAKPKRSCLRHYDLMTSQVINAMGRSGISKGNSKTIWELCGKGNAGCLYLSELCDKDPQRRNRWLSRAAEVLCKAIDRLTTSVKVGHVLKLAILASGKKEADELKPHLNNLWNK